MTLTANDLEQLLQATQEIARAAGSFIRHEREHFSFDQVEEKAHNDFVSYVDRGAEQLILPKLQKLLPQSSILSEESGQVGGTQALTWIVDPLDGTTNFIHSMPPYAVSIGLVENDRELLGVVYEVKADEMFSATCQSDALCNGQVLHASPCNRLARALIATGFPFREYSKMHQYFATLDYFMRHSHGVRRLGSAATDLAYLAAGRVDAFYEYGLKPWDVAAGIVIAKQAGCQFADFQGQAHYLHGGEIIGAAPGCFAEIADYIARTMQP